MALDGNFLRLRPGGSVVCGEGVDGELPLVQQQSHRSGHPIKLSRYSRLSRATRGKFDRDVPNLSGYLSEWGSRRHY